MEILTQVFAFRLIFTQDLNMGKPGHVKCYKISIRERTARGGKGSVKLPTMVQLWVREEIAANPEMLKSLGLTLA